MILKTKEASKYIGVSINTFKLSELVKLPEKKEINTPSMGTSRREGYNKALSELANMNVEVDEEAIWKILIEVSGCKPDKEDCSFPRCNIWGTCKRVVEAIASQLPMMIKRKE
jgi:hypothetical protein